MGYGTVERGANTRLSPPYCVSGKLSVDFLSFSVLFSIHRGTFPHQWDPNFKVPTAFFLHFSLYFQAGSRDPVGSTQPVHTMPLNRHIPSAVPQPQPFVPQQPHQYYAGDGAPPPHPTGAQNAAGVLANVYGSHLLHSSQERMQATLGYFSGDIFLSLFNVDQRYVKYVFLLCSLFYYRLASRFNFRLRRTDTSSLITLSLSLSFFS